LELSSTHSISLERHLGHMLFGGHINFLHDEHLLVVSLPVFSDSLKPFILNPSLLHLQK